MSDEIIEVTKEKADSIIDTRKPEGLFYIKDDEAYVGIDNSGGNAFVEEFKTKEKCFAWLKQEAIIDKQKLYKKALDTWGNLTQIVMVFEEMSELQKELSKNLRGQNNTGAISEEIADVEIMLEQMKLLYDIEELVEFDKRYKLERLKDMLED